MILVLQDFHFQKNNNHEIMKITKLYVFLHKFKLDSIIFDFMKGM